MRRCSRSIPTPWSRAAKAGSTAADGDDKNSPFTSALLKYLASPGLDVRFALGHVRDDVLKNTKNRQEPFVYGSLGGSTVALVPPREPKAVAAPAPVDPNAGVRRDYEFAAQVGTKEGWDSFLAVHTSGLYAELARASRAKLLTADEAKRLAAAEAQRKAGEQAERERLAKIEKERLANEQAEREKAERAKAERETAERERLTKLEAERTRREQAERESAAAKAAASTQTALLTPATESAPIPAAASTALAGSALILEIKKELKRVGCYAGRVDEKWSTGETKESVRKFTRYAKLPSVPDEPASDFLDALRGKSDRVCPLECGPREVEKNGQCVAIAPASGIKTQPNPKAIRSSTRSVSAPVERSGDATKESMKIRGPGTIPTGQTVVLTGQNGRKMTCTGGSISHNIKRTCTWH